jgi:hypothetical protein
MLARSASNAVGQLWRDGSDDASTDDVFKDAARPALVCKDSQMYSRLVGSVMMTLGTGRCAACSRVRSDSELCLDHVVSVSQAFVVSTDRERTDNAALPFSSSAASPASVVAAVACRLQYRQANSERHLHWLCNYGGWSRHVAHHAAGPRRES